MISEIWEEGGNRGSSNEVGLGSERRRETGVDNVCLHDVNGDEALNRAEAISFVLV